MNSLDKQYVALLAKIQKEGIWDHNRTGIRAKAIVGHMIQHDMSEVFPLLCIKKHSFKSIAVELEFFLRGLRSKKWLQDRGCNIWNSWANPQKVSYGTDEATKLKMAECDDLGRIYGVQWRNFESIDGIWANAESDQVQELISLLKKDPTSRRAIVTSWNPCQLDQMSLPPCHVMWQVMILDNKLHLTWYQRSVDTPLGLPYNIASYGLLLHLLARELGYAEGTLTGMLNNVHYYENQEEQVNEIIAREQRAEGLIDLKLPSILTRPEADLKGLLDSNTLDPGWTFKDSWLENYNPLAKLEIPIAV